MNENARLVQHAYGTPEKKVKLERLWSKLGHMGTLDPFGMCGFLWSPGSWCVCVCVGVRCVC